MNSLDLDTAEVIVIPYRELVTDSTRVGLPVNLFTWLEKNIGRYGKLWRIKFIGYVSKTNQRYAHIAYDKSVEATIMHFKMKFG